MSLGTGDASLEGERKTVTILFADIKGSMELMEDLDPEEARAIVDPALNLMMEAVQRYGGYVAQSTGDGIFAMFGAPVAYEDHPQRALYAALRMQEELKRHSDRNRSEGRLPVQVRIGVNSGEVVVRSIQTGEAHSEYVPIGHATSLAARMQALAPIGSIGATEPVRKLCEGYFTFKSLGPTKVKGVREPVGVNEVTGLGPLRTRLQRAAVRGYTKFVGRDREMESLLRAAEQARAGHGQIVAAMADPGVGKSRLLFEFKAVSQSGWMVLETVSVSFGRTSAFLPIVDLLHSYFKIMSDDDERARREKVNGKVLTLDRSLEDCIPYLFALLGIAGTDDRVARMDAQTRKRRTLDAIKRVLLRESLNQPLIVVIEDLHWIDDETQAFLSMLADSIATARILLMVSYRPEYRQGWGHKTYYTQLRLDPLGEESADAMLRSLLGDGAELAPLKHLLIERTEGNPFFMEETIEAPLLDGALVRNGGVKLVKPIGDLKIPPTVQDILASRIDRLPLDQKGFLQTLAVIGRDFSVGLVRKVVDGSEDELDRMLHDLQLAEFIYEQPAAGDIEYIFKHALTQEVAYKSVLVERRRLLHEKTGAVIEALFAQSLEDQLSLLAHHYGQSSNHSKAVEYLERAAQQAMRRAALKDTEVYLERALAALSATPASPERERREFNLQFMLWEALSFSIGLGADKATHVTKRLKELGEKTGDPKQLIAALGGACSAASWRRELTAADRIAAQMVELGRSTGSGYGLTYGQFIAGQNLIWRGELDPGMQQLEAAAASYNESDWSEDVFDLWAEILAWRSVALWFQGKADQARATMREAISLSERSNKLITITYVLDIACDLYLELREPRDLEEVAARLYAVATEQELQRFATYGSICRGWAMAERGHSEEGVTMIHDALQIETTFDLPPYLPKLRAFSEAQARSGQLEAALATIDRAISIVGEMLLFLPDLVRSRGELHFRLGDEDKAADDFREALALARRMGAKPYELRVTTNLVRLLAMQGKREVARTMLADIYNWFTEGFDTADLKDAKALLEELST